MIKVLLLCLLPAVLAQRSLPRRAPRVEKYNLHRLPWDVRPVWWLVGEWRIVGQPQGNHIESPLLPFADRLDFGIGILPMFGARSLNYTGHIWDPNTGRIMFNEYGYMLVKNATKFHPEVRTAFLTVSDRGYTTLEEGLVKDNRITYEMKQFGQRSFNLDNHRQPTAMTRTFMFRNNRVTQAIEYTINGIQQTFQREYKKVFGATCRQGCQIIRFKKMPNACSLCV